ncbi:MAG: DNA repair protein RadA [Candidatus Dormibacteraeota bacterium]|nr:DNA repair protein RadA [Candidatus Dormibacteraeota bacterium]
MAIARSRNGTRFECSACGVQHAKWEGRCAACGAWNALEEVTPQLRHNGGAPRPARAATTVKLASLTATTLERMPSGLAEVDRVLGGGLVPGTVALLGGDPGVGKSTLALQMATRMAAAGEPSLYCSGEESVEQVGLRAARVGCSAGAVELLMETDVESVIAAIESMRPALAIIDSVQTLLDPAVAGGAGSPSQVRNAVARLVSTAKSSGVALALIGHVTKDGAIAGPRTLEHMVDVVLYLEGERLGEHRMLRGIKNRFGSTGEVGLLAMDSAGIRELTAPERAFLDPSSLGVSGNVLTVTCDGLRPLPVEVQALAVKSGLPVPRRTCSGFDFNRLCLLLAVLEKRGSLPCGSFDVFLNVAGGIHLSDAGVDLAVALAVAASLRDRTLPAGFAVIGELGLGGEVRPVARIEARLAEAIASGATDVVLPAGVQVRGGTRCSPHPVSRLGEALALLR